MSESSPQQSVARITGITLALYLLSGRWSLARLDFLEAWVLFEPRVWIVAALVAIAYSPALSRGLPFRASIRGSLLSSTLMFLGFFIVSTLWAPSSDMPWTKAYEMVLVAAVLASVARIARWAGPHRVMQAFWDALAVALGLMALMGLASSASNGGQRLSVLGGGPNVFGRNMVVLLMIALSSILGGTRKRSLWGGVAALAAVLALLSGSRGAILGIIGGTSTLVYAKRLPVARFVRIAIALVIFGWFVVTFTDVGQTALHTFEDRFLRLTIEDRHDAGRMPIYEHAWAMGWDAPLVGQGLAAFAASGFHVYPHNIVLEAFCEGGLVGTALLLTILVPTLARLVMRDPTVRPRDLAIFVVLLTSSMFTGDFYDSRGVLLLALLISMQREPLHPR